MNSDTLKNGVRAKLVEIALSWESAFGNAPHITAALSEFDASQLIGATVEEYSRSMQNATAVQKGHDFIFDNSRYQVKGNRPSGKRGSRVTKVPAATNHEWDFLIWIHYDKNYEIQEAWRWKVDTYKNTFKPQQRLSPAHYRNGERLK